MRPNAERMVQSTETAARERRLPDSGRVMRVLLLFTPVTQDVAPSRACTSPLHALNIPQLAVRTGGLFRHCAGTAGLAEIRMREVAARGETARSVLNDVCSASLLVSLQTAYTTAQEHDKNSRTEKHQKYSRTSYKQEAHSTSMRVFALPHRIFDSRRPHQFPSSSSSPSSIPSPACVVFKCRFKFDRTPKSLPHK